MDLLLFEQRVLREGISDRGLRRARDRISRCEHFLLGDFDKRRDRGLLAA